MRIEKILPLAGEHGFKTEHGGGYEQSKKGVSPWRAVISWQDSGK
jgi:hypothetical protein